MLSPVYICFHFSAFVIWPLCFVDDTVKSISKKHRICYKHYLLINKVHKICRFSILLLMPSEIVGQSIPSVLHIPRELTIMLHPVSGVFRVFQVIAAVRLTFYQEAVEFFQNSWIPRFDDWSFLNFPSMGYSNFMWIAKGPLHQRYGLLVTNLIWQLDVVLG